MAHRVAFVGFGEVAAAFSLGLSRRGALIAAYDVLLEEADGAARLAKRASGLPVEFLPLPAALAGARFVFSTVTTSSARQAAARSAPHLAPGQFYIDLNASMPSIKEEIERIVRPSGAAFVEGALLGAVGVTGAATAILTGGPNGVQSARELSELGLNATFFSEEVGKASTFKMLRSIFSKGMEALLIEFLTAGERAGMREALWKEVTDLLANHPFEKVAGNWIVSHVGAHERRYHEMMQVTEVMRALGVEPVMTAATEEFFRRSGSLGFEHSFREKPAAMDQVIRVFEERLRPAAPPKEKDRLR
jgi:3-hydroxyisobutyrate dehydrogenase-like beta-hydroxyacid dehydrogenase